MGLRLPLFNDVTPNSILRIREAPSPLQKVRRAFYNESCQDPELRLAFLHGEQVLIGILLAAAVVFVGFPVLLYIWLWHTKASELKLAIAFFVSVTALAVMLVVTPNDPTSILTLAAFSLSFILTLPWSALASFVLVRS